MKKRNHQALILTTSIVATLVGSIAVENAKVNAENPRVSVATGNILSNTNAVSISGELVAPPSNVLIDRGSMSAIYGLAPNYDPSQIVFSGTNNSDPRIAGNFTEYSSVAITNTVEAAIARSIRNAVTTNRYGDVIGIVNAYNPPQDQNIENASVGMALSNILSNTNSQNLATEIVAAENRYYNGITLLDNTDGVPAFYFNATQYGSPDSSQVLIWRGLFSTAYSGDDNSGILVSNGDFTNHTVEGAITHAINTAVSSSRFGDVIGITNVYKGPGTRNPLNARFSIAMTGVLSNTNSLSGAGEVIAPENYFVERSEIDIKYTNASSFETTGFSDPSQLVIRELRVWPQSSSGIRVIPSNSSIPATVDSSIANAINQANNLSRYGDVIGIVNAYKGPWTSRFVNPSASLALTNILSNINSQNFAAEIVAPNNDRYLLGIEIRFQFFPFGNYDDIQYIVPSADSSQLAINSATVSGLWQTNFSTPFTNTSVEAVTANAIRNAETQGRIGDVIGITKAWQSGGRASLD
jgi:hypothetical protein